MSETVEVLGISQLYEQVSEALARSFPPTRPVWVRGEIQSLKVSQAGHCYIDLVDPGEERDRNAAVLKVNCWRSTWEPMKRSLAEQGIVLEEGMVVTLGGRVGIYEARGQIDFTVSAIDVNALVGEVAARRAALVRALETEGLLGKNRALVVPLVPLNLALVASPQTEGASDFLGQIRNSGFSFVVRQVPAIVQGPKAPASIAGAIDQAGSSGCDLVVVVRGGGSRADLAAFDSEPVARAIVACPVPVWVGVGHTGDQSVADLVANRSFVTPTECGQALAQRVLEWWTGVVSSAGTIGGRARQVVADVLENDARTRQRLTAMATSKLDIQSERLGDKVQRLALRVPQIVFDEHQRLVSKAEQISALAKRCLDEHEERVASRRTLLGAFDVERQLERGYTLTYDETGSVVRSVDDLSLGQTITTRFAQGLVDSTVVALKDAVTPELLGNRAREPMAQQRQSTATKGGF